MLPLSRDLAIAFSRMLLTSQTPAWKRQQAVKTLAVYRDLILETEEDLFAKILPRGHRAFRDYEECGAALIAAQFRNSSIGKRCRYSHGAGTAGAKGCSDNDDLYSRDEQTGSRRQESGGCDEDVKSIAV